MPEALAYWQSREHGLDYVVSPKLFVEVKRGRSSPVEFSWFPRLFRGARLIVLSASEFETEAITGMTLEQFLEADVGSLAELAAP